MFIQIRRPDLSTFSTHQLGNIAVGEAHAFFAGQGWMFSTPLNDTKEYDTIIDVKGQLVKVQIKFTNVKCIKTKNYIAHIGNAKKTNQECDYDYLFICTASKDKYWISKDAISNKKVITLNEKMNSFNIELALL